MASFNRTNSPWAVRGIPDNVLELARTIREQNPPVDEVTVNRILGDLQPHFDNKWTQAMEDEVERKFQTSGHPQYSGAFCSAHFQPLCELWRVSLRIFRQAPPMMLSRLNSVQFVSQRPNKNSSAQYVFTNAACQQLSALVVHPVWQQTSHLFLDALAFAGICRLNVLRDLRLRFGDKDKTCPALRRLNEELDSLTGDELRLSLHEAHKEAREAALTRGEQPSAFSDLLFRIGQIAAQYQPSNAEEGALGNMIVPFNLQDIQVLIGAIDGMNWKDPAFAYKVTEVYEAFKQERDRNEMPRMSQLHNFHVRAVKQTMRIESCPDRFHLNSSQRSASEGDDGGLTQGGLPDGAGLFSPTSPVIDGAGEASSESQPSGQKDDAIDGNESDNDDGSARNGMVSHRAIDLASGQALLTLEEGRLLTEENRLLTQEVRELKEKLRVRDERDRSAVSSLRVLAETMEKEVSE
ncbi:hypothetical protein FPHYL_521 [Fusarium phyllophilum]|uniref:Uncharacterized protein n=1 Tax=Fusarium phyllophilum TaxID=47803 RepID=A0A8H5NPC1_9HYPO|nr:hypothetical protein FPHYL_521 [Fusarium phyllophilum]